MSDTGIIIRFWHNKPEEMNWRYNYFVSCVLPRLQKQTDPDFDICLLSPPNYREALKSRDNRIKPFTLNEPYDYSIHSNFDYDQTVGLKRYKTAIRMDSDDLVSPEFVSLIKNSNEKYVSFQPELFLLDELRTKKMNHRYSETKPSCFLGIKDYDRCIYHQVFFRFNPCKFYGEGHCFVTIHDRNYGTNKNS